jgi:hypothetical protein
MKEDKVAVLMFSIDSLELIELSSINKVSLV